MCVIEGEGIRVFLQLRWPPQHHRQGDHDMNTPAKRSKYVEVIGLAGIGVLLLAIAAFVDPIGSSPDTGVLDLGVNGTKRLLGVFGVFFIAAGIAALVKARSRK